MEETSKQGHEEIGELDKKKVSWRGTVSDQGDSIYKNLINSTVWKIQGTLDGSIG